MLADGGFDFCDFLIEDADDLREREGKCLSKHMTTLLMCGDIPLEDSLFTGKAIAISRYVNIIILPKYQLFCIPNPAF